MDYADEMFLSFLSFFLLLLFSFSFFWFVCLFVFSHALLRRPPRNSLARLGLSGRQSRTIRAQPGSKLEEVVNIDVDVGCGKPEPASESSESLAFRFLPGRWRSITGTQSLRDGNVPRFVNRAPANGRSCTATDALHRCTAAPASSYILGYIHTGRTIARNSTQLGVSCHFGPGRRLGLY